MFLIKRDANGDIERYKPRLVAKGFSQRPGFDYFDTFAPTARWSALCALLSIAAIEDLEIDQIDISNAFLNGDVDADIYVDQPEGFVQGDPEEDKLHLHKGLYGLKQSPRLWHQKLDAELRKLDFVKMSSEASIWVYKRDGVRLIVPVFVDDLLIIGKSRPEIDRLKDQLARVFKFRDLGPISFFLGVKVTRDRKLRKIWLSQDQYAKTMLARYGFADCRPLSTPMSGNRLSRSEAPST